MGRWQIDLVINGTHTANEEQTESGELVSHIKPDTERDENRKTQVPDPDVGALQPLST